MDLNKKLNADGRNLLGDEVFCELNCCLRVQEMHFIEGRRQLLSNKIQARKIQALQLARAGQQVGLRPLVLAVASVHPVGDELGTCRIQ